MKIDPILERLAVALRATNWRIELGPAEPALLAAAEAALGNPPLPDDYRRFLARVRALENRPGDVFFVTARDFADPESMPMRRARMRRHAEEVCAGAYPEALAGVRAMWDATIPFLFSLVNGEDLLALELGRAGGSIVEIWDDAVPGETRRACATDFTHFLEGFTTVVELGPSALDGGWRLRRSTLDLLRARDPSYHEPLVSTLFDSDFHARTPISWPPPRPASPQEPT